MKDCTWELAANSPEDTIAEFNSNMDKALRLVTECPVCNMAYNSERALRQFYKLFDGFEGARPSRFGL
jgi:hypothetical protein